MKRATTILAVATVLALAAGAARADWFPGDPYKMHYPQTPDLSPAGMDVRMTPSLKLGDDFKCSETGPITDIHLWASWLNDMVTDPGAVIIDVGLYSDVPAGPNPYSHPGLPLWRKTFQPGSFLVQPWAPAYERFYDPQQGIMGYDTLVWQYNLYIDPVEAYVQEQGRIYWLVVQAMPLDPTASVIGWKTTDRPFNDDAVWGLGGVGGTGPWHELIGPDGTSLNLSFVITPEPATLSLLVAGGLLALRRRRR